MKALHAFFARLPRALSIAFGAALAVILCLLCFFEKHYSAYIGSARLLGNLSIMALVVCALAAALLCRRISTRKGIEMRRSAGKQNAWMLLALYAVLFAAQCVMARSLWFYQGFDASNVRLWSAALATGQPVDPEYFRLCPNNAPLTVLLALPYWVGMKLGLAEPYVMEVYLSALCVNLSCLVCVLCARRLTQSRAARGLAFALSTLWLLFSPYIVIPYTDTFAILFPVLAFYAMLSKQKAPVRYGLAALAASLGAAVKPSALIILLAILLLGACRALTQWRRGLWKRVVPALLAALLGFLPGRMLQNGATALLAGSAKPEEMLGTAHYLMIGTDDRYWGGHSVEGLAYSQSFPTLAERNEANLRSAWQNIAGRSVTDNLYFFSVKAYKAYADGAFAWNGSAAMDSVPKRTDALSKALRSFFYYNGDRNPLYCTLAQAAWLLVLLLSAVAAFACRRRYPVQLLSLTLLGLTGYQLLFECWPRYLFLYAPLFVLLASLGWERASSRISKG